MSDRHHFFSFWARQSAVKYILGYIAFAIAWLFFSEMIAQIAMSNSKWQKQIVLAKDILFISASCAYLFYVILPNGENIDSSNRHQTDLKSPANHNWRYFLIFSALILSVPLAGYLVVKIQTPLVEEESFQNLRALTQIKGSQIEEWIDERRNIGVALLTNDGFIRRIAEWQKTNAKSDLKYIRGRLESLLHAHDLDGILLVNTKGRILVNVSSKKSLNPATLDILPAALLSKQVQQTNTSLHDEKKPGLNFIVPLHLHTGQGAAVGAIILDVSPVHLVFPKLPQWRSSETSGELLLVRQQKSKVVYLSQRLNSSMSNTSENASSSSSNLAAIAIREGKEGITHAIDYRNKTVLAAYRPISETDWFLIAKIDRDEVLYPVVTLAWWVSAMMFFGCLILSLIGFMIWLKQKRVLELELNSQSKQILKHFYDLPFIGLAVLSPLSHKILQSNHTLSGMLGYTESELNLLNWENICHPQDRSIDAFQCEKLINGEVGAFNIEKRLIRRDGKVLHALLNVQCIRRNNGLPLHLILTIQDITQRKTHDLEVFRLTQLYSALSHCNQAIIQCKNENELYESICQIAVKFGNLRMAWVGLFDFETSTLKPVAHHGDDIENLKDIRIPLTESLYTFLDSVPDKTEIESYKWCELFPDNAQLDDWRDQATKLGLGTASCLLIRANEKVVGLLILYPGDANELSYETNILLHEIANDVSFALDNINNQRARISAERQLRIAYKVFENSSEGILITDAENQIVMINRAFTEITGYTTDDVEGENPKILSSGRHSREYFEDMWDSISLHGNWQGEIINRRKNGEIFVQRLSINHVTDENSHASHYIGVLSDLTQTKESEERLNWFANFDTLTGLPNRKLLNDRYVHAMNMVKHYGKSLALLLIDIDNFKNINDSLGYQGGDQLLAAFSTRLTASLREQDTVARLGGDNFAIMLPDVELEETESIAKNLLRIVFKPYLISEQEFTVTASIGIALAPGNGEDFDTIMQCADAAMYQAKKNGRNGYKFYAPEMHFQSLRKLQLENGLRKSLDNNQLVLHYQPQVALSNGRIVGAEALIRWNHPAFGMVPPDEFISIAEDSGMILPIGEWVLRTAAKQMKEWALCGYGIQRVAINLSAVQFRQPDLIQSVIQILKEIELEPKFIEFELTESTAMENPVEAAKIMNAIHENGIRISIDDFGTGHSSLANLKRFNAYKVKIDRAFVRDVVFDLEDRAIVVAILQLASNLGLKTIAEGVETREQMEFLQEYGCHEIQGYYIGKPQTAAHLEEFMSQYNQSLAKQDAFIPTSLGC